ncbi:Ubp3 associated protein Bre5 [Rubripirellula amarantea]|uniref:Ubp3 associated protein Bre5 n=1 Tax=Rubripirellula amarantea TaxID=2527999 RepID=A0A5C5WKC8_9BACT|nr:cytochrome c oxidase accessory protein CcoG [Rubripirellula amarantea]TWT51238.1 Ubp3 associated protein Bre5 [Rubripirellula amarantea]
MTASDPQPSPTARESSTSLPLLDAPEHVLSTLEADGSRRWLRPRLSTGDLWKRRRIVAYALIAFFVALPHLRIAGKPPVLIDILAREFTILGHTFLPTDTLLLALAMLFVFVVIVATTAISGRLWCGWGCPQTVYMEFVFRPIDRLIEGTVGKGGKPKGQVSAGRSVLRIAIYLVICTVLAHTFLAYFVGTDRLAGWLTGSPFTHPVAFLVMAGVTALMMFDFLVFREQMCLIACPYGRFQSVMLDRNSLIVAYDEPRGEPRKKGKHVTGDGAGSCVDCNRCVDVCPTGIDIRNGLQMECINCTQCIDACNDVMDRVGAPRGLIRYSSQDAIDGKPQKFLRLRTIIYPLILIALSAAFVTVLSTKYAFDARLMRGTGNPFYRTNDGQVANRFRLRLTNRTEETRNYRVTAFEPAGTTVTFTEVGEVSLPKGGSELLSMTIAVDPKVIKNGRADVSVTLADDLENERVVTAQILGPR